jgi:hypothetical protein
LMGGRLLPGQVLLPFSQPGLLLLLTLLFLIPSSTGRSYSGEVDQLIDLSTSGIIAAGIGRGGRGWV